MTGLTRVVVNLLEARRDGGKVLNCGSSYHGDNHRKPKAGPYRKRDCERLLETNGAVLYARAQRHPVLDRNSNPLHCRALGSRLFAHACDIRIGGSPGAVLGEHSVRGCFLIVRNLVIQK